MKMSDGNIVGNALTNACKELIMNLMTQSSERTLKTPFVRCNNEIWMNFDEIVIKSFSVNYFWQGETLMTCCFIFPLTRGTSFEIINLKENNLADYKFDRIHFLIKKSKTKVTIYNGEDIVEKWKENNSFATDDSLCLRIPLSGKMVFSLESKY